MAALSAYYGAPPASLFRKNIVSGTPEHPVQDVPSPHNEAPPVTGTGTEQGQAISGGAQGIGGGGTASGSGPQGGNGSSRK